MNLSIKNKIIALAALFICLLISSTLFLLYNLGETTNAMKGVVSLSEDVVAQSHHLEKLIVDMETGQRGFVITGKEEFLEPYRDANNKFDGV
ncbi:MAG: CHASE3 domain-containing protein, partial [Deltaproteobacteria bacterium]|nr:CHASE3 domain-containing protein [Deltaproteobacteria bacterium]